MNIDEWEVSLVSNSETDRNDSIKWKPETDQQELKETQNLIISLFYFLKLPLFNDQNGFVTIFVIYLGEWRPLSHSKS